MSTKKTTKTSQTNTLPEWLTSPYQAATQQAQTLAQQPAISSSTQQALTRTMNDAAGISAYGGAAANGLSSLASGNFGANGSALTGAANGSFLASNLFAQNGQPTAVSGALNGMASNGGLDTGYIGQSGLGGFANGSGPSNSFAVNGNPASVSTALSGFTTDGSPTSVSGALNGFRGNGKLDTSYLDSSRLNDTANGQYLTADSNPYIRGVAQQGADAAQAAINGQFGAAGRSNGSGLYAQLFGQGISDATNSVYAQNYANERQLQQSAQNTLLSGQQTAREAALARQYGADSSVFGAENSSAEAARQRQLSAATSQFGAENSASENALSRMYGATEANLGRQYGASGTLLSVEQAAREAALGRQYGAQSALFGAQNASAENAVGRQASAYEAERSRQQAASSGLLSNQLSAYSQIPGLLSAISSGNAQSIAAGGYMDQAGLNQQQQYTGILSGLSNPFGMSSGTAVDKTSGLGNALNVYANLLNAMKPSGG